MRNKELIDLCFVEYKAYKYVEYEDIITEEMFQNGLCERKKNGVFIFKCVGIILSQDRFFIVFPKSYIIPREEKELKQHIQILILVLNRYAKEGNLLDEERAFLGGEGDFQSLGAAFWILQDYQEYGFIKRIRKQYTINHPSHINWPRTIKNNRVVISNGRPLYFELVTQKKSNDISNILYFLHRHVVQKSYQKLSWLVDIELDTDPYFDEILIDKDLALHVLEQELRSTFIEREIILLKFLIEFIRGTGDESTDQRIRTLVTLYFQNIWEAICGYVLSNEYELFKSKIPRPIWRIPGVEKSSKQKPDIVFQEENFLYIVDAKYYDMKESLPGWHDLVKQFFYAYSMEEEQSIINILIFPSMEKSTVVYKGYVEIEGKPKFGQVEACTLDIYIGMKYYGKYTRGDIRKELTQLIKRQLGLDTQAGE